MTRDPFPEPLTAEALAVVLRKAGDVALKHGHLPLKQRRSFECSRCGKSGNVSEDGKRFGKLFREPCA